MLTLGVDLAAADERTALAMVEWRAGKAEVRRLRVGVSDDEIIEAVSVDIACIGNRPAEQRVMRRLNGGVGELILVKRQYGICHRKRGNTIIKLASALENIDGAYGDREREAQIGVNILLTGGSYHDAGSGSVCGAGAGHTEAEQGAGRKTGRL